MKHMNQLVFFLLLILLVQLSFLRSSFVPLPQISYGIATSEQIPTAKAPVKKSYEAQLTKASSDEGRALVFVGDVLLARNLEFLMIQSGSDYPYRGLDFSTYAVKPFVVGNFESSIPETHYPTEVGKLNFSVDKAFLPALRAAGFTHLSLANNHSLDQGKDGLLHTQETLTEASFSVFGEPASLSYDSVSFLNVQGKTVALIAIHAVGIIPSLEDLQTTLSYASRKSTIQIIYVHWGTEYSLVSDAAQRKLADQLVAAGADVIIGHHPHVVQNIDVINGVPVFYSLGNYIFDQYFSEETMQGLSVHLDFSEEPTLSLVPVTSKDTLSQPQAMSSKQHAVFLNELAKRSAPELQEAIRRGVIPLSSLVASSPKIAMISR